MKRFWIIAPAPVEEINTFEKAWEYDLIHNVIAIGWAAMGDISSLNENQLKDKIEEIYPNLKPGVKTSYFNSLWNFWHNIQLGDIIIARKGRKRIAAVGKVTGTTFYDTEMGKERMPDRQVNASPYAYQYFIPVEWMNDKKNIVFDKQVFSMQTIYEIAESKYEMFLKGNTPDEIEEAEHEIEIVNKEEGNDSNQYLTDVGRIDILAQDTETNSYVVIELKKERNQTKLLDKL